MTRVESAKPLLDATQRLVRAVDALTEDDLAADSELPGWTRAHLVAHLTLNAEALEAVMRGFEDDEQVPMYSSAAARNEHISELADSTPAQLRERFLGSVTLFNSALTAVPAGNWTGRFSKLAGTEQTIPRSELWRLRLLEVEIHHADLAIGYGPSDWPEDFLDAVFNAVVEDREGGPPMMLRTPDGDVPVTAGGHREGTPTIWGTRADLTWWLLGRGGGRHLQAEGPLPELEPWR